MLCVYMWGGVLEKTITADALRTFVATALMKMSNTEASVFRR